MRKFKTTIKKNYLYKHFCKIRNLDTHLMSDVFTNQGLKKN